MSAPDRPLEIVIVSSEALPYAKTGGLADVTGALAGTLAKSGCRVYLIHPYYRCTAERFESPEILCDDLAVDPGDGLSPATVYRHTHSPGATAIFIGQDDLFDRSGLYGDAGGDYADNALRFGWFCRAALLALRRLGVTPDLIHCHDWQSALIPLYLHHRPDLAGPLGDVPTLLTIHNLAYQGIFPHGSLAPLGVPGELFTMEGVEFYGNANVLKGGILSADAISTVSVRYSREIQTAEFGAGLENVLLGRSGSLHGILNGIDSITWDPAADPFLAANFSVENLAGKEVCKQALLDEFGLPADPDGPLMATIARLVDQKGFDLVGDVLAGCLEAGFRYVLLGSGDGHYRELFTSLAGRFPDRMAVRIAYDEALAHRIEAGADFFLMPSRFEPCGLNQMYSLRYGTIPIVRATGGLDDTVENYQPGSGRGNGLKFEEYSAEALVMKIHEAMLIYRKKAHMDRLVSNALACDFSWEKSASQYLDLYRSLLPTAAAGDEG